MPQTPITNFTPGPWLIATKRNGPAVNPGAYTIASAGDWTVQTNKLREHHDEFANLRLIANAPLLYTELKKLFGQALTMRMLSKDHESQIKQLLARIESIHVYTSTACQHEFHGECRITCKFCDTPCICPCHESRSAE